MYAAAFHRTNATALCCFFAAGIRFPYRRRTAASGRGWPPRPSRRAPESGLPAVRLKRWLNLSKVSVPREFQQKLPVQGAVSGKRRSAFHICSRFQQSRSHAGSILKFPRPPCSLSHQFIIADAHEKSNIGWPPVVTCGFPRKSML